MPIPTENTNMSGEAKAYLTDKYRLAQAIPQLLKACTDEMQSLESAIWQLIAGQSLVAITTQDSTGKTVNLGSVAIYKLPQTNSVLDTLGEIVGAPVRGGAADMQYLAYIYLQIAVNRSNGTTTDWSQIANVLLQTSSGPVIYTPAAIAAFDLFVGDMALDPNVAAHILIRAVGNGTAANLTYSTWPPGDLLLMCDANNPTTTGQGVLGDAIAGGIGGKLVSAAVIA